MTQFEGYERVEQFKYLGSIVTENNELLSEIKTRLTADVIMASKNFSGSSLVTIKLKLMVYKTIIKPVVMYGAETRALTKRDENLLNT